MSVDIGAGSGATTTTLPPRPDPRAPAAHPRSTSTLRLTDLLAAGGAAIAALSLTALIYTQLAPFDGALGFVVLALVLFLGCYTVLVWLDSDGPVVRDRLAGAVVHTLGFLVLSVLIMVIFYTFVRGRQALPHVNFFIEDMSEAGPLDPLDRGGIAHAVVGTLIQITIALAVTVPLSLVCAVFLNEIPGRFAQFVRTITEAMTALPSIVAGLFIYATLILSLGMERCAFCAALAISVMMLPIIIRSGDVVIRLVPGNLREAALALGATQWRTVWHVVLPTARSGLTTAVILGTARGIGETSPVLLTAGGSDMINVNPIHGWSNSLPLAAFKAVQSPAENMVLRGFGTATTLLGLVLILFLVARAIGGRGPGQLSRGQLRRRARASAADAARFARRAADRPAPPGTGVGVAGGAGPDLIPFDEEFDHG